MSQERWLVVLRVVNGPLAAMGPQTFRGPIVRIGANPGPGGFKLTGYRGLDARQCVISVYDSATAQVTPVGTNQVRQAPHDQVKWKDIDPMSGPEYLSQGCVLHLGPVGRGCTMQFVEARALGEWAGGGIASQAADVGDFQQLSQTAVGGGAMPPASYDARRARQVSASGVPLWFFGIAGTMVALSMLAVTIVLIAVLGKQDVEELGPVAEGVEYYPFVDLKAEPLNAKLRDGLRQPFYDFVVHPSRERAGADRQDYLADSNNWDQKYYDYVTAASQQISGGWAFFVRLEAIKGSYAQVVGQMQAAKMPEVFAAIPYHESRYKPEMESGICAKGFWQYMPEVAHRLGTLNGLNFDTAGCSFKGHDPSYRFTPEKLAPPGRRFAYADKEGEKWLCKIERCQRDDRTDLTLSTDAAVFTLGEALRDNEIAESGASVPMAIMSHHMGYDDARFSKPGVGVLHAYKRWRKNVSRERWSDFYGANITVASINPDKYFYAKEEWLGSVLPPNTQHYGYQITAEHIVAVCYFAKNHATKFGEFGGWSKYAKDGGYCGQFRIPSPDEVRKRSFD